MTAAETVAHLVGAGVVPAEVLVRDGVRVRDVSRRHLDHLVTIGDGQGGVFVKQGVGAERRAAVAAEAAVLALLAGRTDLAAHLPTVRHVDAARSMLVLDAVPGAVSLREHHHRTGRLPVLASRGLGRALARLHDGTTGQGHAALHRGPAPTLRLHRPTPAALDQTGRGARAVLAVLQGAPGAGALLDAVAEDWHGTSLLHGDVRWDNVLLSPAPGARRVSRVTLVDWELAQLGDPAWDLGCAFGEHLAAWVAGLAVSSHAPPGEAGGGATPLARVHASSRALWHAYLSARRVDDVAGFRLRAVRYAACRLLQSALERADRSAVLPSHSVVAVQLGLNLLAQPLDGATHLLGLDLGWSS
ncbi:phosphotransferase [Actinotalea ferrariae]|nr:phosphotransferase [Actinotalea ferrariae]